MPLLVKISKDKLKMLLKGDDVIQDDCNRESVECACVAISKTLRQLLQERKIDAIEFLSIVGHLPIRLSELDTRKWKL